LSGMFNGSLLQMARQARGRSQKALSDEMGITQGYLSKLEHGLTHPIEDVVHKFSRVLGFPKSFFFQTDRPSGLPFSVHAMYRKKASVLRREKDLLEAELNIRLLHIRNFIKSIEIESNLPLPQVDLEDYGNDFEAIANLIRGYWHLPSGPIIDLIGHVEQTGCIVSVFDFGDVKVDGVTINLPDLPPCIFLNSQQPLDRLRFSLAHELGHLVLHSLPTPNMEEEANAFASAFLLPKDQIYADLSGRLTVQRLAMLKPKWRVSMQALLYRAKQIGAISDNQSRYLWSQMSKRGFRLNEPIELELSDEVPSTIEELIQVHLDDFNYSIEELSKALHIYPAEFETMYGTKTSHLRLVK